MLRDQLTVLLVNPAVHAFLWEYLLVSGNSSDTLEGRPVLNTLIISAFKLIVRSSDHST
jgi:hypothetical protein